MRCRICLALLALALAAGCTDDFNKQSRIIGLRVLGVQAEPAELIVSDGGPLPSTTLTALAIDPAGGIIVTNFSLCLQQGVLPAANLACPGDGGVQLPDAGPLSAELDLNNPAVQAVALTFAQSFDGGPADAGFAALLAQGLPIAIGFSADAPAYENPDGGPPPTAGYSDQHLIGFTDVTLRSEGNPINHNPQLEGVMAGNALIAADGSTQFQAGQTVTLTPVPASDAKEVQPDGGLEPLDFAFYVTDGDIADLRSDDTTATGEPGIITTDYTAPDAGTVRLWVVVRDGRGGIGWIERDFSVAP